MYQLWKQYICEMECRCDQESCIHMNQQQLTQSSIRTGIIQIHVREQPLFIALIWRDNHRVMLILCNNKIYVRVSLHTHRHTYTGTHRRIRPWMYEPTYVRQANGMPTRKIYSCYVCVCALLCRFAVHLPEWWMSLLIVEVRINFKGVIDGCDKIINSITFQLWKLRWEEYMFCTICNFVTLFSNTNKALNLFPFDVFSRIHTHTATSNNLLKMNK